ncbi:synaptobrevin [Aaosphaeria arxii CBS 175.79]|uniref:Synaptobrevin homolog YKT6 n=1 Tax=Aaosphaeria arxii CBS 175.79 TaxID=1450172 RepID=A0A6A5Y2R5_9PLEO|nr:synaptobrevin [Aaosphaeria arxii CBS 175.79]KAF2019526.1 synaptobrevin [Aaosphaeria arxii CBS 175.79]
MKLYYISVWKNEDKDKTLELASETDLSSFSRFTRGTVNEFLMLFATKVAAGTRPGSGRTTLKEEAYSFHVLPLAEGLCGLIATDHEYPERVAQSLLTKITYDFKAQYPRSAYINATEAKSLPFPELKEYLTKFQDPESADNLSKIQKELQETKTVLHKTIESVLERGEKIDSLVAKSDNLSAQSKMFYTQAKKQNSCCVVM